MSTPPPSSHGLIDAQVLAEEELVVLAPASSALAAEHVVALADLRQQPVITLLDMHCLGQQIEGFCTARGLAPKVVCRTAQIHTIIEMVSLGLGVSIVPEMAVAPQHLRAKTTWARLRTARPRRPIIAVWRRDRQHAAAASRLVEIVRGHLATGVHDLPSL